MKLLFGVLILIGLTIAAQSEESCDCLIKRGKKMRSGHIPLQGMREISKYLKNRSMSLSRVVCAKKALGRTGGVNVQFEGKSVDGASSMHALNIQHISDGQVYVNEIKLE